MNFSPSCINNFEKQIVKIFKFIFYIKIATHVLTQYLKYYFFFAEARLFLVSLTRFFDLAGMFSQNSYLLLIVFVLISFVLFLPAY